jgi:hypothetical protein
MFKTKDTTLVWPGKAGQHQRDGASASLGRELGDNYETYHAFLKQRLETYGGRAPDPAEFDGRPGEYFAACEVLADLLRGEAHLRWCHLSRKEGRALRGDETPALPVVDAEGKLLHLRAAEVALRSKAKSPKQTRVFPDADRGPDQS